jgi:hypothetical protein
MVMHMMWLKNVIIRGMQGSKTEKCFICAGRKKSEFMESDTRAAGLWHAALRAFGISAAVVCCEMKLYEKLIRENTTTHWDNELQTVIWRLQLEIVFHTP